MLKKISIVFVLILSITISITAQDISGKWKGTREGQQGTIELNYLFKVDGTNLTGTLTTQMGEVEIKDGVVDGKVFSFTISFNDFKIENKGEILSEDEISMTNTRGTTKFARVKE